MARLSEILICKWNKGLELTDGSAASNESPRRPVIAGGAGVGGLLSNWNQVESEASKRKNVQVWSVRSDVPNTAASVQKVELDKCCK